jgi:hypothetical protein
MYPLQGAEGAVWEVPMRSIGWGAKRFTIIGGSYFRLLPLKAILHLLARTGSEGFVPLVYLHPYDIDPSAAPLSYPAWRLNSILPRAADRIRRSGRKTAADKFRAIASIYDFHPIEVLEERLSGRFGDLAPTPMSQL